MLLACQNIVTLSHVQSAGHYGAEQKVPSSIRQPFSTAQNFALSLKARHRDSHTHGRLHTTDFNVQAVKASSHVVKLPSEGSRVGSCSAIDRGAKHAHLVCIL